MDLISPDTWSTVVLYTPTPWWEQAVNLAVMWVNLFWPMYLARCFELSLSERELP